MCVCPRVSLQGKLLYIVDQLAFDTVAPLRFIHYSSCSHERFLFTLRLTFVALDLLRLFTSPSERKTVDMCVYDCVWMMLWDWFYSQRSETAVKRVINIQEHLFEVHAHTHINALPLQPEGRRLFFSPLTTLTPPSGSPHRYGNWDSWICIFMNTNECAGMEIEC